MRFVSGIVAAVALAFGASAWAQSHNFGPAVGATLSAISAPDQTGATRSLASLSGENGTVLLVTRAADWCPYCQAQMIGLEGVRAEIEQRGYNIVTISTDTVEELARFQRRRNIGYTMLSDEQAQIVRQLDLLDPTQPPNRRHNGLPVPTILILSPQDRVLAKLGDANFRVRPAPEVVVATLDGLR
ncbi:MAG: peroxiredoxin family protein [Hyphomonadaceae bacterium]|nr:peroxiredoxin family protein [Hyphomonadaceae bacterium]